MITVLRHKGCGGKVVNHRCQKCGRVWGKLHFVVASDVEERVEQFDREAYKRRIRNLEDL